MGGVTTERLGSLGEESTPALLVPEELLESDCAGVRCSAGDRSVLSTDDISVAMSVGVDLLNAEAWLIDTWVPSTLDAWDRLQFRPHGIFVELAMKIGVFGWQWKSLLIGLEIDA